MALILIDHNNPYCIENADKKLGGYMDHLREEAHTTVYGCVANVIEPDEPDGDPVYVYVHLYLPKGGIYIGNGGRCFIARNVRVPRADIIYHTDPSEYKGLTRDQWETLRKLCR